MIKLAATVTFYNPTCKNVNNINSYIECVDKVYIVDNSSKNNKKMVPNNPKIVYIANMDNLGVATALNIAAKMAIKDGFDWLLTMDQDSKFSDDNLKKMIDYIEENDCQNIGLISPWHVIKTGVKKPKKDIEDVV